MPETNYFWDPLSDNILQERDEVGTVLAEYTTEPKLYGTLISQNKGPAENQYHFDALGSTLALTDDNQQVTDAYSYTAFGGVTEHTGSTVTPFQYVGRSQYSQLSATEPHIYVRARTYFAAGGRFASLDPFRYIVGSLLWTNYEYARNCPTIWTDPSGLIDVRVDQGENMRTLFVCGGYRIKLWYTVPESVAPGQKDLWLIQEICVFQTGSTTNCAFGAPPSYSCACADYRTTLCKPCCYLEVLNNLKHDQGKKVFGPAVDDNYIPQYSSISCNSRGAYHTSATVRAFEKKSEMLADILLTWKAGVEVCSPGCRRPVSAELGPHIKYDAANAPKWWSDPKFRRDEIKVDTHVMWNCCNDMPETQSVTLPTGEVLEWREF